MVFQLRSPSIAARMTLSTMAATLRSFSPALCTWPSSMPGGMGSKISPAPRRIMSRTMGRSVAYSSCVRDSLPLSLSLSLSWAWGPVKVPGHISPPNSLIGLWGAKDDHIASSDYSHIVYSLYALALKPVVTETLFDCPESELAHTGKNIRKLRP